jgi:sulfide dehydrogenase cytochrome subunit
MKLLPTVAGLGLLAATGFAQAADPNLPRNLAATCANCHGTNGKAVPGAGIDALNGVEKAKACRSWPTSRAGAKPASIMHQIVKGYTDEQLDLIASYFAAQK